MLQSKITPDYKPRPQWNKSVKLEKSKHKPIVYEFGSASTVKPKPPPEPPKPPIQNISVPPPAPIQKMTQRLFSVPTVTQTLQPDASFSANIETFASNGVSYFKLASDPGSSPSTWASFPAISSIQMSNFNINSANAITASTLTASNISTNTIVTQQSTITQNLFVNSGAISMLDSSGTHILESINGDLFFDTELLAKANDIQNIADWSLYPALSTINVATNNITGAQQIQTVQLTNASGTFGTSGQFLTSDGTTINWVTPTAPNISNWATFPAAADVNMGLSSITSTNTMTFVIPGFSTILSGGAGGTLLVNGTPISTGPGNAAQWATFPALADVSVPDFNLTLTSAVPNPNLGNAYKTATIKGNLTVGDTTQTGVRPDFNAFVGSFNVGQGGSPATAVNIGSLGTISMTSLANISMTSATTTITSGLVSVVGVGGVAITGGGDVAVTGGAVQVSGTVGVAVSGGGGVAVSGGGAVTVTGGVGVSVLGGGGVAVTGGGGVSVVGGAGVLINSGGSLKTETITNVSGTGNTLAINNLSTINGVAYPPSGTAFIDAYQIYVAPNGNNTTGTGSQQNPFLTIAQAIIQRATLSSAIEVSIILSSGTYTENFTLAQNTFLCGIATGEQNQPCNVIGNVILGGTAGQVGLSGLQITAPASGVTVTTGGGVGGTYSIYNCNLLGVANLSLSLMGSTNFITECRINGATGNFTAISIGVNATVLFRNCNITATSIANIMTCGGNLTMRDCSLSNTSANSTTPALVTFTGSTNKTLDLALCSLIYTSPTVDTGGNKCCLQFANTAGTYTASITNCLLICEGATIGNPQIQCIQDTGAGSVILNYGNLLSGATAHHISPTISKTQYQTVP